MKKNFNNACPLFFVFVTAISSLYLQFAVIFGDPVNLTKEQALHQEIIIWRFIAVFSLILFGLIYICLKSNRRIKMWFSLAVGILALIFPVATCFSYFFHV